MAVEKSQDLPDRSYLSLTEAFTWILDRDCRDDDAIIRGYAENIKTDSRAWDNCNGPGELLGFLQTIKKDTPLESLTPESADYTKAAIYRGQKWLSEKSLTLEQGLELAEQEDSRRKREEAREMRLQALCFKLCGNGDITLFARELDPGGNVVAGVPKEISHLFYAKPVCHTMGNGYYKSGELARSSEREGQPLEILPENPDPWPIYIDVQMTRYSVESLQKLFTEREVIENRKSIFDQIERGILSPTEGQLEFERLGFGSLLPVPDQQLCDPMRKPIWSFAMACAWIATRNIDCVQEYTDEHMSCRYYWQQVTAPASAPPNSDKVERRWVMSEHPFEGAWDLFQFNILDDEWEEAAALSPVEAAGLLWDALLTGKITATAVDAETGRPDIIPGHVFSHLVMMSKDGEDSLFAGNNQVAGQALYRMPLIRRDLVLELWPLKGGQSKNDGPTQPMEMRESATEPNGPAKKTLHQIWPDVFPNGAPRANAERLGRILEHLGKANCKMTSVTQKTVDRYIKWREKKGLKI